MAEDHAVVVRRLWEVNAEAAAFYASRLTTSAKAARYLHEHAIAEHAAPGSMWRVGYAPRGWTSLTSHLRDVGFTKHEMVAAGLGFIHRTSGHLLDRFRDRLMFPVTDEYNRVVAFTSRDLSGRADAKWINTPQTAIYRKRLVLYGLGQQLAQPPPSSGPPVVFIVEGAADVLAVRRMADAVAGEPDTTPTFVVAPCGTNLSTEHLDLLHRMLPDASIVFAFDGDDGGRRAVDRVYPIAKTWPRVPSAVLLPQDTDPADLLAQSDPVTAMNTIARGVRPLAQVLMTIRIAGLRKHGRITDPARFAGDRITAYNAIAELFIDAPQAAVQMAKAAAEQLGLSATDIVRGVIEAWETRSPAPSGSDPPNRPNMPNGPTTASADTRAAEADIAASDLNPEPGPTRATVSATARTLVRGQLDKTAAVTRHDDTSGVTIWALADGIGRHQQAATAATLAAEVAATVALRSAPAAGVNAARAALNDLYAATHPGQAGDASIVVVAAYPSEHNRHKVRFELAWAGNCRAYTIRAGNLAQITLDHTAGRTRRAAGETLPAAGPADLLLTSSVRAGDISVYAIEHGPILLCNNALHTAVPTTRLTAELAQMSDAPTTARRLTEVAGSHHHRQAAVLLIHATGAAPDRVTSVGPIRTTPQSPAAVARTYFPIPPAASAAATTDSSAETFASERALRRRR